MADSDRQEESISYTVRGAIDTLARALTSRPDDEGAEDNCVLFLGAGAATDPKLPRENRLPLGSELSASLAEKCGMASPEYIPLSTTAFYYESFYSRDGLENFLKDEIGKFPASATIQQVAELAHLLEAAQKQLFIVTTNYDQSLENEYNAKTADPKQQLRVIGYDGRTDPNDHDPKTVLNWGAIKGPQEHWQPVQAKTYLYKMHGCISRPQGMVITEEDYINFLTNAIAADPSKRLLREVVSRITKHTILFLGYSLTDWNFRVIFKATAEKALADRTKTNMSYAIQKFVPESDRVTNDRKRERWEKMVGFWARKEVTIIDHDAAGFLRLLIDAVKERQQR